MYASHKYLMKYIGNYAQWIDPKVISVILTTNGDRRPSDIDKADYKLKTADLWAEAGIDVSKLGWEFYYKEHVGDLDMPISTRGNVKWWFSKLMPGDMFPLHYDHFEGNLQNVKRYWMACQDYEPGHVFIYKGKNLEDYKAGDLYEISPTEYMHAAANLGFIPKISLQITVYE